MSSRQSTKSPKPKSKKTSQVANESSESTSTESLEADSEKPKKELTHLEQLKKRKKEIIARIQKIEADNRTKQRKLETRRKILVGAAILKQVKKGKLTQHWLDELLDAELTERERALFRLHSQSVPAVLEPAADTLQNPGSEETYFGQTVEVEAVALTGEDVTEPVAAPELRLVESDAEIEDQEGILLFRGEA